MKITKWKVRSFSGNGIYTVTKIEKGGKTLWKCSCPHWIYRRRECKHIRYVKENEGNLAAASIKETRR